MYYIMLRTNAKPGSMMKTWLGICCTALVSIAVCFASFAQEPHRKTKPLPSGLAFSDPVKRTFKQQADTGTFVAKAGQLTGDKADEIVIGYGVSPPDQFVTKLKILKFAGGAYVETGKKTYISAHPDLTQTPFLARQMSC